MDIGDTSKSLRLRGLPLRYFLVWCVLYIGEKGDLVISFGRGRLVHCVNIRSTIFTRSLRNEETYVFRGLYVTWANFFINSTAVGQL